ncbi:tRNA uridine-5-carboxymethylaminomethyl(34) synthesis GTPase MnmE [Candidatus Cyanaurora vandensis]|uniref:tRNA uridine-5-carboxymethylaminomethyl(34) synthesis GTPase MnmE n=1 Tax=Candidatus Cyanaurora vandensis TaxID=2714958 RepID=UPI00257BBBF3|nr:tRNA uridine-5-carboxymethylaminomethyl(34) synthesis GTPase MnmE [Candidatus Cyanaurora vandensis]
MRDTIAAIATPLVPEQGSVAIVRLSGPEAQAIATQLFCPPRPVIWESHRIYYGHIQDRGRVVDEILLLWMQAPRSFTREDVVEFHGHGGVVVIQEILRLCLERGARLAQPGEFTLRAFLNGRLDLTQAESVAQLVSSRSPQAAHLALAGLTGKLAKPIQRLRTQCLGVLAELEARIDFEEDLPPLDLLLIETTLAQVETTVHQLLATADQGELLRTGIKIAIVGRPNVGKSSLLNCWSQRERAIVSAFPGTTRDVVDVELMVRGMPVIVLDTAGIRETSEMVEGIGIERSRQAMAQADLVLLVIEATQPWTAQDQAIYQEIERPCLIVVNKTDLAAPPPDLPAPNLSFSALKGAGIPDLEAAVWQQVSGGLTGSNVNVAINQRQKQALIRVQQSLQRFRETQRAGLPLDFWSIDLREAISALSEITGDGVTESILDNIFSRFCIGK